METAELALCGKGKAADQGSVKGSVNHVEEQAVATEHHLIWELALFSPEKLSILEKADSHIHSCLDFFYTGD